ncbi:tRNA pseudouridine(55) synthase TruB [Actinotalea sp. Marseille-Q4924]|uniref:tRNA pseudouridine(55) synthase TruB n=1 Tax=Actinotalea sp. Marseille-Q4924 TaxID=2866571 RepID=UPI001CE3BFED|nr:tRNA pseudouridine(55) synthase TruB [Actinotalea sp. Marseille-Q4924]
MTTAPSGLVVVDKPAGWTSHDVVARVRRLAGTRKVGHAGTLDPMATGVLVLGVERATRLLTYVVGADKDYEATVRLGATTTTDDAEGETLSTADASGVTQAQVRAAVVPLTGPIQQVPSAVSAIKVDGKRSYARVRAGEDVVLPARPVVVHAFDVRGARQVPTADGTALDVDVAVTCSSGTYVRALARDLGAALGVGGHLTALRRTRVGGYGLAVARTLEQLEESFTVLSLEDAARAAFAVRELDDAEAVALGHGKRIASAVDGPVGTPEAPVAAFAPDGGLVALLADADGAARPLLVLRPA